MQRPQNPPRGTIDLLSPESLSCRYIENLAQRIFESAGFQEVKTPIFEATEIFVRAAGEASDIVNKEMYTFEDRSGRSLTLRPEGTAGVVRAYLTNGLDRKTKPVKLWYSGEMFRYERSQVGRYRQFRQIGVEIFASGGVLIEFEAITLALKLFQELKIKDLVLEINSVGDFESRKIYQEVLRSFLKEHENKICPDCQKRSESNPIRALDCKIPEDQELYKQAPKIKDYLNNESLEHHKQLIKLLEDFNINYIWNESLVRGLDYYNNTVFEIKTNNKTLANQNTICAGGRYDSLVKDFGGDNTPAFGWALGLERVMQIAEINLKQNIDFFLINELGQENIIEIISLANKLRNLKFKICFDYDNKSPNKQFELAKKLNAEKIIIFKEGKLILKDLLNEKQFVFENSEELIKNII